MEQMQFENQYEITKALIKSWYALSQKRSAKNGLWLNFFISAGFGICAVVSLLAALMNNSPEYIGLSVLFAVMLAYRVVYPSVAFRQRYRQVRQALGSKEAKWIQTVRFGDRIEIESGNSITTYPYDRIRFIDENEECFYLWNGTQFRIVVYKNAFTVGDAEAFSAFIDERCSEREPLWTQRELRKHTLRKHLPRFIMLAVVLLGAPLYLGASALNANTVSQAANSHWKNEVQVIATVELPGAAVAFGTDGADSVYGMLLRKVANHYGYANAHSYSITAIDHFNKARGELFESDEEALSFSNGKAMAVYGVADAGWWKDNVAESKRDQYASSPFQCGDVEFVLYYRALGNR